MDLNSCHHNLDDCGTVHVLSYVAFLYLINANLCSHDMNI